MWFFKFSLCVVLYSHWLQGYRDSSWVVSKWFFNFALCDFVFSLYDFVFVSWFCMWFFNYALCVVLYSHWLQGVSWFFKFCTGNSQLSSAEGGIKTNILKGDIIIGGIYARIQLPILPKISENKTCSQNFDHEGIKFHQPNFFQTSSDMSSWISESFINLGRYLDMELIFLMKLISPKKRTKNSRFSSTFFVFAKFSGRRSCRWVFKLFLGRLR